MPGVHKDEFAQRRNKLMEWVPHLVATSTIIILSGVRLIAASHTGMTHDKHVVIIPGGPVKYMSADVPWVLVTSVLHVQTCWLLRYRFHQNTDLLYLTGFMEPDSLLILETGEGHTLPDHKAVLYVRARDPYRWDHGMWYPIGALCAWWCVCVCREMWDGPRAGTEDAVEFTGVDEVGVN